jgi:hypothetical protein
MIYEVTGDLPQIVRNDANWYEGDLRHYFQLLFNTAANTHNPYHNFRHVTHVLYLCHDACVYYGQALTKRQARNLLVAAIFHDWDHTGRTMNDMANIMLALSALDRHILEEDKPAQSEIVDLILATEWPHATKSSELGLMPRILRDADLCQTLNPVWIQQVVYGLSVEMRISPLEVLKMQEPFLKNMHFGTKWAQSLFPQHAIDAKIKEAKALLSLVDPVAQTTGT